MKKQSILEKLNIYLPIYSRQINVIDLYVLYRPSLVAQMVKHLPAMQETWVQSVGEEDLLEKEMAINSIILAWRIPWTEKPGGPQSMGVT